MQFQVRTGPIQNDQATISPEMMQGSIPERSRVKFRSPRTDPVVVNVILPQTLEFLGYQPEKPRIKLAPRIPLPTFIDSPSVVGPDMFGGYHPDRPKPARYQRTKFSFVTLAIDSTTFEFDWGTQPSQPAKSFSARKKVGLPILGDVPAFISPEETQGVTMPRPRLFLGPRIGQPISQTTHTAAAVSSDMFAAYVYPSRGRLPRQNAKYPTVNNEATFGTLIPVIVLADKLVQIGSSITALIESLGPVIGSM